MIRILSTAAALLSAAILSLAGLMGGPDAHELLSSAGIEVHDGDTISVPLNGERTIIRYLLIDTPELHHPRRGEEELALEAAGANRDLISSGPLRLEFDEELRDRYERLLAYVWVALPEGELLVNEELVRRGFALPLIIPPNGKHAPQNFFRHGGGRQERRWALEPFGKQDFQPFPGVERGDGPCRQLRHGTDDPGEGGGAGAEDTPFPGKAYGHRLQEFPHGGPSGPQEGRSGDCPGEACSFSPGMRNSRGLLSPGQPGFRRVKHRRGLPLFVSHFPSVPEKMSTGRRVIHKSPFFNPFLPSFWMLSTNFSTYPHFHTSPRAAICRLNRYDYSIFNISVILLWCSRRSSPMIAPSPPRYIMSAEGQRS